MSANDRRLIEDYLPIEALSKVAVSEKSVRPGHISTLHLWWARRPLVAMRAAVYGTLVGATEFGSRNEAAGFVERLCQYPGDRRIVSEARDRVLAVHGRRTGQAVPPPIAPKVLDLFAGGGAIPLEVLRLGGDAYALELNPVAYLIELSTLVFPQKYGKPDGEAFGSGKGSKWAGLVSEVNYWGERVLSSVRNEIGDLYPPVNGDSRAKESTARLLKEPAPNALPEGYLLPVAYLWTRTVRCRKPTCHGMVPMLRQTWLCRKEGRSGGRYAGVRRDWDPSAKRMRFKVVEAESAAGLGFDPGAGSRGAHAVCPGCQTPVDDNYVKEQGKQRGFGHQLMAVVCDAPRSNGRIYRDPDPAWEASATSPAMLPRAELLASKFGITIPDEPLEANPRSFDVQHFGFTHWRDVFAPRQLVAMVAFTGTVRIAYDEMKASGYSEERARAVTTCLTMALGRLADYCTSFCTWQPEFVKNTFNSPGLPMIMDYAEANPLADSSGGWPSAVKHVSAVLNSLTSISKPAVVVRGSALSVPWEDQMFDAIITDPPYYDSRSYSNLSDHFYVWHKRSVGHLYPEHFASPLTPKRAEAIAASYRHGGNRAAADVAYESKMQSAFREAHRLLKPGGPMACVYAHKTTAGWATLINALRGSGFVVVEAWPVEMERRVRQNAQETAALASSIILVTRKRDSAKTGAYERVVRPALDDVVRERVSTLWAAGIQGADLVVAAVAAGLQAFTRYPRVDYENGEEVPAERFLAQVETVVLETILARLSQEVSGEGQKQSLAGVDPATRFYILWRYTYRWSELDAGEAIIFAQGTHVELDGPHGLSTGSRSLLEKKKSKYRLRDFRERGNHEDLGKLREGQPAPLIDALQRTLWLMENRPGALGDFLGEAQPNLEQMRLVAHALAGPALKGGELAEVSPTGELAALSKLTSNWRSVIEDASHTPAEREARRAGQGVLFGRGNRR